MLGEMGTCGSMVDGTSFESARVFANRCDMILFSPPNGWRGMGWSEPHREVGASAEEHGAAQNSATDNLEVRGTVLFRRDVGGLLDK